MKNEEFDYDEKKIVAQAIAGVMLGFVVGVLLVAFSVCLGGCSTLKTRRNAGDIRQSDAYVLGGIESAVSNFDDGIGRAIRESQGIADEVDRLEFLFNRYEQHALRLRDEVDSLRRQIEVPGEGDLGGGDDCSD